MWNMIQQNYPIWYFDCTGGVHRQFKNNRIFLYSIVCHDIIKRKIVPVAEFITNHHTAINVTSYLTYIKETLKLFDMKFSIAPVIVTDQSPTLLLSVMSAFNSCSVFYYLEFCYRIIIENNKELKKENDISVIHFFCSTHFLKNIINKTKKTKESTSKIYAFRFSFAILQNSRNKKEFEENLSNIYILFNFKHKTTIVINSLNYIKEKIREQGISTSIDGSRTVNENERDSFFNEFSSLNNEDISNFHTENYKKCRIKKYYDDFLQNIYVSKLLEDQKVEKLNDYYSPILFDIIREQFHLIPFWTGIMIGEYLEKRHSIFSNICRLSNNPVENWFSQIKLKVLNNTKSYITSEISKYFYKNILALYNEYAENQDKNILKKLKSDKLITEKFKEKKKIYKKGFYYKNIEDVFDQKIDNEKKFNEAFSTNNNDNLVDSFANVSENFFKLFEKIEKIYNESIEYDSNIFPNYNNLLLVFLENESIFEKTTEFLRKFTEFKIYETDDVDESFETILKINNIKEDLVAVKTIGDGNCFYRAISYIFFGTQEFYKTFKCLSIFQMIKNKKILIDFIGRDKDIEVEIVKSARINEYANELNISSMAILINKCIVSFSINEDNEKDIRPFTQNYSISVDKNSDAIGIGFKNNHFVAVIKKKRAYKIKTNGNFNFYNKKKNKQQNIQEIIID